MIDVFRHLFIFTKLNTLQKKKLFTILQTHKFCKNLKNCQGWNHFLKFEFFIQKLQLVVNTDS